MPSHSLPFNLHRSADRPLYAVLDTLPTLVQPSLDDLLIPERISARGDNVSKFFPALCARYQPSSAGDNRAEQRTIDQTEVVPALPVDWTRKEIAVQRRKAPKPLPEKYQGGVLQKSIYTPHGKWAWVAGLPYKDSERSILLSSGVMCSAFLRTGTIGDQPVKYISKVWATKQKWHGFFSELALYKVQLKSLQGRVVPAIINVYSSAGAVDVAMEPPHHSFWIEASADMPHVLKKRCVQAFEKLHAAGVYHGDIELRHMIIGGDARVTIIDFQASRALVPNSAVQLAAATADDLRMEMRKVKFKLDYEGARAWEDEKLMRNARLKRRNRASGGHEEPLEEDRIDPPIDSREWNLEWIGKPVEPTRFVMPGQSTTDLESAVGQFLSILEKLEEEEAKQDGASLKAQRKSSPDFKAPAVPSKASNTQAIGMGFGATVLHPTKAIRGPRAALKRKSECERPQDSKRIRVETPFPSTSSLLPPVNERDAPPPPIHSSPPPAKVRDFAIEATVAATSKDLLGRGPQLAPMPMISDDRPIASSPRKRKRNDEPPATRGRPKLRTSVACDISSAISGEHATEDHAVVTSTSALFRWIGNLWRFVY
ncbi:hypothetical protein B0H15DRAFT_317840 [Mycena belliarum]|uniref:Uncharacterized protein n=1 Tax=Mycena belliarum TaxID=1033014 RepID=A0AAD6UMT9_9AGAR|nr:hypothetical protein B0H15DRAFT_317840 [Mycena belliae]